MRELASIDRGDGYQLVVLQAEDGAAVLRVIDPSGRPVKRFYMKLRTMEVGAVATALARLARHGL
jgi:hypothetical protein